MKVCSKRVARADTRGIRQTKRETGGESCDSGPRGSGLPPPQRHRALQPQGSEYAREPKWGSEALGHWDLALPARNRARGHLGRFLYAKLGST